MRDAGLFSVSSRSLYALSSSLRPSFPHPHQFYGITGPISIVANSNDRLTPTFYLVQNVVSLSFVQVRVRVRFGST